MKHDPFSAFAPPPRSYVVLDLESAVVDTDGHRRYQAMERWTPADDDQPSRRNYQRSEDPLKTPRWPFQTIVTASIMVLGEHIDGNLEISRFVTLSAPDHDEAEIVTRILRVLENAPRQAELVSWGGAWHDLPLLTITALKHGLSLPEDWKWIAWGGDGRVRHVDLSRVLTGGFKMKPVHMAEYCAALNIPSKISAPAFAVTKLIYAGRWDEVQEVCEGDVISTALLLARWRRLLDPRAEIDVVEDRLLRQIERLRAGRGYLTGLRSKSATRLQARMEKAASDLERLAPWLSAEAA